VISPFSRADRNSEQDRTSGMVILEEKKGG